MSKVNEGEKYNYLMCLNHWLMAIMIFGMIAVGWFMVGLDPAKEPYKWTLYAYHEAFGLLVLGLIIFRAVVRSKSKVPPYPENIGFSSYYKKIAKSTHLIFYPLIALIPILGILMNLYGGYDINFFITKLPKLANVNQQLSEFFQNYHRIFAYVLLALIGLHIAATLKHLLVNKVNLMKRINL
jgi:cytochrome b561